MQLLIDAVTDIASLLFENSYGPAGNVSQKEEKKEKEEAIGSRSKASLGDRR